MNRIARLLSSGLGLGLLVLAGRLLVAQAAPDATSVCGAIGSHATWTVAGSPYEVCAAGATVNPGVNLTIEPGVSVQFQSGGRLTSRGTLLGLGTPTQPITFTGLVAAPGSWQGLVVESLVTTPTHATLNHVTFRYGGLNAYAGAQIYADRAVLTITHSLVSQGLGSGLYGGSHAVLSIHDTAFLSHGLDAMRLVQPQTAPDLGGLSASGNGRDVVFVDGTTYLPGEQYWTAAGIPYLINNNLGNAQAGHSLSIAPGSELRFTATGSLYIRGHLQAIGLPGQPITLTGATPVPGFWTGLVLYGLTQPATAQLDYVTVEYGGKGGGSGANILVDYGHLIARHSRVRHSLFDGVRFGSSGRGSIMNSQVTDNAQYGVRNLVTTRWVLAANNWWGDPAGPTADVAACSPGHGDKVTNGVSFRPVLTSPVAAPFPLIDAPILTLTPRRWFAPADGTTQVYFDITVRDGNGTPLPGRMVDLISSLGTATGGGITDANGRTLAYLVSSTPGEAEVAAALSVVGCEGALSPSTRVTFNPPLNTTDLFPNAPAPYVNGQIRVSPMPVIVGVPSTMAVTLTNPLSVPITVDVTFGFLQSSIGLVFGPIKDFVGQVIPANSSVELSTGWIPPVSGHFCVQARYTITAIGGTRVLAPAAGGSSGLSQRNLNSQPAPTTNRPNDKDALRRADNAFNATSSLTPKPLKIQKVIVTSWWQWAKDASEQYSENLGGDPPRQDFDQITVPIFRTWPDVQPSADVSPARANAANAINAALADVVAYGEAATVALDRYGGASAAGDMVWAAQQANAQLDYQIQMGTALLLHADALEAFVQVLVDEGETEIMNTVSDVLAYQTQLSTTGFTAEDLAAAQLLGRTEADIEAYRLALIAADPNDLAGNILDMYREEAAASRALGLALTTPDTFRPGFSVGGSPGLQASASATTNTGNTLAQVGNVVSTFLVGNPLTQTAIIDLRPRRLDLPADWMVSVSPAQVTLPPGEQTTATVTILTGSLVPQNTVPRVAVEGYAGTQLLGGVAVDIVVPRHVIPFGINDIYIPIVRR